MRTHHPGVATLMIGSLMLLECVACGTSTPTPTPTPMLITLEECRDRHDIGSIVGWMTSGPTT